MRLMIYYIYQEADLVSKKIDIKIYQD